MTDATQMALNLASCAKNVANYCDHAEHAQHTEQIWISGSAQRLRFLAVEYAASQDLNLIELYAKRLRRIERNNPIFSTSSYKGEVGVRASRYWQGLQGVQFKHDAVYHPDVSGLTPLNQLRHYAFHLAKLAGYFSELALDPKDEALSEEVDNRRLPDTLLFGIKLSTVIREVLPKRPLPRPGKPGSVV